MLKCRTLFLKVFCFQLYSVQYSGHLHLGVFKASSVEIYGGLVGAGTSSLLASSTSTTPHISIILFARFPLGTVNRRHPTNVHMNTNAHIVGHVPDVRIMNIVDISYFASF